MSDIDTPRTRARSAISAASDRMHVCKIPSGVALPFPASFPPVLRHSLTHDATFKLRPILKALVYQFTSFLFLPRTTITPMSRVFQPKLSNPLHTDSYNSVQSLHQSALHSPLRPILKVRFSAMPHPSLLTAVLQTPVTPPRGLHVRWSEPLCQVKTFLTLPQQSTSAPDAWGPSYMLGPDTTAVQDVPAPMSLHNAMDQDKPSTVTPMYSPASKLEDITRMNLSYLMASKGIIFVPHAPCFAVQSASQLFSHTPSLHQTQKIPSVSYTNTAQPSTSGFISTRSNDTTEDSSSYMTEDDSILQSPSHTSRNSRRHHKVVLTQSMKTDTPLFPKHKPKHPLTKPRIFDWANGLNRLWYLLEQGKYNQNHHDQLRSLLRSISNEKDCPGLHLMWLKDTKLIEILKKFKKDKRLQEFDPWVRCTVGHIIQFWRARFTGIPSA